MCIRDRNDSVWVQFSDAANSAGSAAYRIGTSDALMVNLEPCSGCGVAGWGWADTGYWTGQSPYVMFGARGTHTIRVQTREDGAQVDQIVLSPATYLNAAPGSTYNDTTSGNSGGAYRSDNVDLEASADGNNDVGWIAAGEWLNYTVNVASSGSYIVHL